MENLPDIAGLPVAPSWSIAVGEFGASLIIFATIAFLLSAIAWILVPRFPKLERIGRLGFTAGSLSVWAAVFALGILFAKDRFEWKYVFDHSDLANTLQYKISAIWSGQEGSFLLWASMSAMFGVLAVRSTGIYRRWFTIPYAGFLASICAILIYESPFKLELIHGKAIVPADGMGLSPTLINYWVTIHPPTIFLGFGSLTIMFAYAIAAMVHRNPIDWVAKVRPWALVSVALLGLGLCMGGFWAYETLGWGGFWAWDPVENTSFVPWCIIVALIHGLMVQVAKGKWIMGNLMLAGMGFLSFVYGTFLTRSGFLGDTSVHSFAQMDRTALWVLISLLVVSLTGFMGLWFSRLKLFRAEFQRSEPAVSGFKRDNAFMGGNFLILMMAAAAGFGMSVPLIMSLTGQKPKMVEEWLYHQALGWFFIPLMILMAVAPFIGWKETTKRALFDRLFGITCLTIAVVGSIMVIVTRTDWAGVIKNTRTIQFPFGYKVDTVPWTLFLAGICFFTMIAAGWRIWELRQASKLSWGSFISHIGVGLLMAGLILSRGLEQKEQFLVQQGTSNAALGYIVTAKNHTSDLFDRNNKVAFDIQRGGKVTEFRPGLYFSRRNLESPVVWPYVRRNPLNDLYFALHGFELKASDAIEMKPGDSKPFDRFQITYEQLTREGEPGKTGTKFGALLNVKDTQTNQTFQINPKWVLGDQGVEQEEALIGDEFFMMIMGMEASKQSFTLQLHFRNPIYPIELFIKPFTILVWVGTGILTVGLLMAGLYRRPKPTVQPTGMGDIAIDEPESDTETKSEDALTPTA